MILMAMLSWHLYEKQFLKLRRYWPYKYAEVPANRELATAPNARRVEA
jgi:peptidoglycan/LPS O-acetylase OafA/YrhL